MKIITFYLPQFHQIPENDLWWGEGFTEWVNVKKAKPLFEGHNQPVEPLDKNYYDLLDTDNIRWQANLAKKYDVFGFCIYHYWFDGTLLLEKPLEQLRDSTDIDINYCICWANEHWTNSWVSQSEKILIEQKYGDKKEWKEHFDYLLSFFNDSRYIKEDNEPLIVIYRPEIIPCLNQMIDYWKELAIKNGFKGLKIAYQHIGLDLQKNNDDSRFDYNIEYQPMYSMTLSSGKGKHILNYIKKIINNSFLSKQNANILSNARKKVKLLDYDKLWNFILTMEKQSEKSIPGAFVRWDNTPRKGHAGIVTTGVTPEKFEKYLTKQIIRAENYYHSDKLFLFAWNEWAEGGYLEPDSENGYRYLEAIKQAQINANKEIEEGLL